MTDLLMQQLASVLEPANAELLTSLLFRTDAIFSVARCQTWLAQLSATGAPFK